MGCEADSQRGGPTVAVSQRVVTAAEEPREISECCIFYFHLFIKKYFIDSDNSKRKNNAYCIYYSYLMSLSRDMY